MKQAGLHFDLIKKRILKLNKTLVSLSQSQPSLDFIIDLDYAFLNIRKIVEELMLLSVCAHEHAGAKLTENLRQGWNAQKIMKYLSKVNAKFFPDAIALLPTDEKGVVQFVSVEGEYLKREFAEEIYNLCGSILHATNKPPSAAELYERLEKAKSFDILVRALLKTFEIDILGNRMSVLGQLNFESDGPPELFSAPLVE